MNVADIVQSQLCIVSEDKFVENCINSFYGATSCEVGSTFLLVTHGSLDRMAISVEAFALMRVCAYKKGHSLRSSPFARRPHSANYAATWKLVNRTCLIHIISQISLL